MKNEDLIPSYTRLLQHGKGSIAKALSDLNRALLRGSWCDVADEHDACELAKLTLSCASSLAHILRTALR